MSTIPLAKSGSPAWATEVSISEAGTPDEMVSFEATLYDGLVLPEPDFVNDMVELRLIAHQHTRDDRVPAGLPYIEVATFSFTSDGGSGRAGSTHLVLPAEQAAALAEALLDAAQVIDPEVLP